MRPIIKVPVIYGAIAGVIATSLLIALYYFDRHPFFIPVYLDFRILLFGIFIFFTLKELRDIHYGQIIYFWQGMIASFIFVLTFSLLCATGIFIFSVIVPEFLQDYITLMTEQLNKLPQDVRDQLGKNVIESNLRQLPATNGLDLAIVYLWQSFMIGFFISIILSVMLRRQPNP